MIRDIRANLWLIALTLVICSVLYPAAMWAVGATLFRTQAEGSLIRDWQGRPIASRLIAQPFAGEEYFQPRPSAASYNGAASGASNWGASNYLLRDRVARSLGPIVKYRSGPRKNQLVAHEIEQWFQEDRFQGKPGIVAQWATAHPTLAANWVKADPLHAAYVLAWEETHPGEAAQWKTEHPQMSTPLPEDLAAAFFSSFSHEHPGHFPGGVSAQEPSEKTIQPVATGTDIQAIFFDMWRQEHPDADLEPVPADMVMASGSGLDPHITLKNALYQLDRVATKRAADQQRDPLVVRREIEALLDRFSVAPLGGVAGVKLVNVLEMNLALRDRYSSGTRQSSEP